jgi:hypothetical protein
MDRVFEVPFYRDLTNADGWEDVDGKGVKYQVVRAYFKVVSSHMPGPAKLGRKFDVLGAPTGVGQDRIKVLEMEAEIFDELRTIEKSIIESSAMQKIIGSLSAEFGDGKLFKIGGKLSEEQCRSVKSTFQTDFQVTNSTRLKQAIRYEFKDTVSEDYPERICGAAIYQQCRADIYLVQLDFLNLEYRRSLLGLRKKLMKHPFPEQGRKHVVDHPNVIKIGVPIAEIRYWELLPRSSLLIRDNDYVQEVEDDADLEVLPPRAELKRRPYWRADSPTLYQLSNVAFPFKWVNKKHGELTKEDLMGIELGEAVNTGWWHEHGPGRGRK